MVSSKIVRWMVFGTGAALVLATGVSALAQSTTAADVTAATTTAAPAEPFDDLLVLLAQLPEFQGKTMAQIEAEIRAAIQAQVQADAAADAAQTRTDATETETTETETADADSDATETEDQNEAPEVTTVKTITPPREESRERATAEVHEQGADREGHDR